MKYIDENNIDDLPGKQLSENEPFSFRCHSGLDCFNKCCRNLNLFLYPYDVIRLKNNLGISSDQFLEKYVDIVIRPDSYFPAVLLSMVENEEKTCPFLSQSGCSVYPDRSDSCRTFPMELGMLFDAETKKAKRIHFFRPPDFCLGQYEKQTLTTKTWAIDQESDIYNKMTARWADVKSLFQTDPWGPHGPDGPRGKMAFMAAYNTDMFRNFVFNSSFLKRYKVKADIQKKIKSEDVELMKFGFSWIKLYLWGIKTKKIRLR